jgi:hypothetical protein
LRTRVASRAQPWCTVVERGLSREALSHRGAAHFGKVIEKHRDHLDLMAVRIVYRMIQTRADHGGAGRDICLSGPRTEADRPRQEPKMSGDIATAIRQLKISVTPI